MPEPTLLQQARHHATLAAKLWPTTTSRADSVLMAVECMLQHLEQQHAAASGPARDPDAGRRCKVCGDPASYGQHVRNYPGYSHDCVLSEPARVPAEPRCKVCGQPKNDVNHEPDIVEPGDMGHNFEPDIALCDHLAAPAAEPDAVDLDAVPLPPTVTMHELRVAPGETVQVPGGMLSNHGDGAVFVNVAAGTLRMEPLSGTLRVDAGADDLDLDALQQLCDAATCGPWRWDIDSLSVLAPNRVYVCELDGESAEAAEEDAVFIAAARDALPKLIAEVRRLRAAELSALCELARANDRAHLLECQLQDADVKLATQGASNGA